MSHLKLVVTNTPSKRRLSSQADAQRPVPTPEFLARRVLALPLGERTIGASLTDAVDHLHDDGAGSLRRYSAVTQALMLVGIWLMRPETDDDPPMHGMVAYPAKLVKRYPELKRVLDQLDGLSLMLPAA